MLIRLYCIGEKNKCFKTVATYEDLKAKLMELPPLENDLKTKIRVECLGKAITFVVHGYSGQFIYDLVNKQLNSHAKLLEATKEVICKNKRKAFYNGLPYIKFYFDSYIECNDEIRKLRLNNIVCILQTEKHKTTLKYGKYSFVINKNSFIYD